MVILQLGLKLYDWRSFQLFRTSMMEAFESPSPNTEQNPNGLPEIICVPFIPLLYGRMTFVLPVVLLGHTVLLLVYELAVIASMSSPLPKCTASLSHNTPPPPNSSCVIEPKQSYTV